MNVISYFINGGKIEDYTVVGEKINIMKTTFDLNFDFYQDFKQHGYTKKENLEKL